MQRRLAKLTARLRGVLKRTAHEPSGQDGVNCLLLAALDQLNELQLPHSLDVSSLRSHIEVWLIDNRTLIADADWRQRSTIQHEELGQLCSFGDDYWSFLKDDQAVGTHVTVLAICGVLSKITGCQINAQACFAPPAFVLSVCVHAHLFARRKCAAQSVSCGDLSVCVACADLLNCRQGT